MLKIEDNEMNKITEFLSLLKGDFSSLDYIEQDGYFYNTKTKEIVNNFLTYILINYKNPSDLHFYFDGQQTIKLRVRQHGDMIDTPITLSAQDKYTLAKINNNSFSTDMFKELLEKIIGPSSMYSGKTCDFIKDLTIPMFGEYRIRSAACGHDGTTRLIKHVDKSLDMTNYNIMQIKDNPIYTIEAEIKHGIILHNKNIQLTPELNNKIYLYQAKLNNMFRTFDDKVNLYKHNKFKVVLEYRGNKHINVNILKNYDINREKLDTNILNYVYQHYQDFYDPVFTTFVEDVTQIKIDPLNGDFKTPEAFKDYLTTLQMIRI